MTGSDITRRRSELSSKVYSLSSGTLMLNMRFFAKALTRLPGRQYQGTYQCDGRSIRYDPAHLLDRYSQNEKLPVHDQLHMLLHSVFRHWHTGAGIDTLRWDAACDIAAEAVLMRIAGDLCPTEDVREKSRIIGELSVYVSPMTAEKLYAWFAHEEVSGEQLTEYCRIFAVDDHSCWYPEPPKHPEDIEPPHISPKITESDRQRPGKPDRDPSGEGSEQGDTPGEQPQDTPAEASEQGSGAFSEWLDAQRRSQQEQLDEMWRELAREIRSDLEDFGKTPGKDSQYLVQLLEKLDRERCDYGAFLRRFAVSGEVMRADLDSFEPGFYCYGMELYGNVALIEPPEYKETRLVRDFVIAIDTSGSVSGRLVQSFMKKTYNILKSTESFFTKVNIFILQCDTEVREAVLINSESELEKYILKAELKGLGGTDFRPVFEYIDGLRGEGMLTGLKGLIYFTDGEGTFPEKKPPYEAAFAFIGDTDAKLPPWAVKLVLEEEDITDER